MFEGYPNNVLEMCDRSTIEISVKQVFANTELCICAYAIWMMPIIDSVSMYVATVGNSELLKHADE